MGLDKNKDIILGRYENLASEILEEDITYVVHLPEGYEKTNKKYPVVYVLNAHMMSTIACASATVDRLGFELIPEMILIGISNTGRARNYFPQRPGGKPGEADTFLRFLSQELLPFIDKNYRTLDFRILSGQSNTGLFAVYAYLSTPSLFQACIAASPSFGWCLDYMMEKAQSAFALSRSKEFLLYMNYRGKDYQDLVTGPVQSFVKMLEEKAPQDFKWILDYLEQDGHVPITSLNNGLLALFPDYYVDDELRKKGLPKVDAHYDKLSKKYGFSITTSEEVIFNMSFSKKQQKKYDEAIAIFIILLKRYPQSVRGHFFLGETYREKGDMDKAKGYYLKTLEIDPDFEAAKRRLVLLEKDKKNSPHRLCRF